MTRKFLTCALLSALAVSAPLPLLAAQGAALDLSTVEGGSFGADPIANGNLVYIATGRTLVTWDYSDATAPQRLAATAPANGALNSLTRHGDYLYASWRGHEGSSGVVAYSLADPANPVPVGEVQDYVEDDNKFALGVVAANDHLYLFDNNHGVLVSPLADPAHPQFVRTDAPANVQYTRLSAEGNTIRASGRSFIGGTILGIYDVSQPEAPVEVASHGFDGIDYFSVNTEGNLAVGIGNKFGLFDISNPAQIVERGSVEIPAEISSLHIGEHVYGFGYDDMLGVWNIANVDAPQEVDRIDAATLGARHAVALQDKALILTATDLLQGLDTQVPAHPSLVSSRWLAGGSDARDVALHDGHAVLLQPNYGLTVNDTQTLAPLGRFEADLPAQLQARSFEQVDVSGNHAYLAIWGYGLIGVDLSDPAHPVESGRVEFPFAAVLDVEGNYAYVAKWTNGGLFGVVDISDPTQPQLVWQGGLEGQPYRLRVDNGFAYLAESAEMNSSSGGLRIFDLSDPASPAPVGQINEGCGSAFDVTIDSEVSLAYLACAEGLQVIDIADPKAPALVGQYRGRYSEYNKVAQRQDRAWYADIEGLHELDVSDPTAPALLKTTRLGGQTPQRMQALDDGRLLVLGGGTGVHVFAAGASEATPLENGVPVSGLHGAAGEELLFSIEVGEGQRGPLHILSYGGRGDVTMLVKHGGEPSMEDADFRSARPGNNEVVRVKKLETGTYYIKLVGEKAFSGVTLRAHHP